METRAGVEPACVPLAGHHLAVRSPRPGNDSTGALLERKRKAGFFRSIGGRQSSFQNSVRNAFHVLETVAERGNVSVPLARHLPGGPPVGLNGLGIHVSRPFVFLVISPVDRSARERVIETAKGAEVDWCPRVVVFAA